MGGFVLCLWFLIKAKTFGTVTCVKKTPNIRFLVLIIVQYFMYIDIDKSLSEYKFPKTGSKLSMLHSYVFINSNNLFFHHKLLQAKNEHRSCAA